MNTLPYSTVDMTSEEVVNILSIFNSFQSSHKAVFRSEFTFRFEEFSLFETYQQYSIGPVIEVKENGNTFYITFTQVCYLLNSASRFPVPPSKEYQSWCVLPLRNRYGHILIRTETFFDKIHELINPIEVDFKEDADFSNDFYVLTSDLSSARRLLDEQTRNCLKQLSKKNIWLEVFGDKLILGNKNRIDVQETLEMADLLSKIAKQQK